MSAPEGWNPSACDGGRQETPGMESGPCACCGTSCGAEDGWSCPHFCGGRGGSELCGCALCERGRRQCEFCLHVGARVERLARFVTGGGAAAVFRACAEHRRMSDASEREAGLPLSVWTRIRRARPIQAWRKSSQEARSLRADRAARRSAVNSLRGGAVRLLDECGALRRDGWAARRSKGRMLLRNTVEHGIPMLLTSLPVLP